ncbi:MAG: GNAT family N-acetyltransferase [Burkholderiales bacterium]|nr:GNAT family N-acetyltransferase [Burkholderiales bacterium]
MLWEWLHVSLWNPPPAPLRPREVLLDQNVRIYAEHWGRPGDLGVVGELPGEVAPIGACWMRLMPEEVGLAFVDIRTPQLGIALFSRFRQQGHGRSLMRAALAAAKAAGHAQVALTVHPENPAIALYESCGFEKRALRNSYHLMVARLGPSP